MADDKMTGNINFELMCEVHDGCELLPFYCMDCDCPLCSYCITCDHVGHKFQNVSEVVETQLRQLEESLGNEHAVLHLQNFLSDSEVRQKQLAEHRENLLRNVVDREEEIIEKVKLWREKMTEKIISLTDNEEETLEKDKTLASALLKCKEKNLDLDIDHEGIKIISLNCGLRNILNKDTSVRCFDFQIGTTNDDLFSLFGKLIDETEELSSDICQCEEEEEEFHDCFDFKVSMKFTFASDSIDNIVPLQNSKTIILNKGTVFDCKMKTSGLKHRAVVLKDVQQIVLIPSCGDVLSLMKDGKCIKRISSGSFLTTYMSTLLTNETYKCIGPGGEQAYACVLHELENNYYKPSRVYYKISLSDEFGRILSTFTEQPTTSGYIIPTYGVYDSLFRIFVADEKNTFVHMGSRSVKLVHGNGDACTFTTTKTYNGSVGTSPSSAFSPKDIVLDKHGNILVAVFNDNAIHFLDKTLTFQKLLMTEEDGLYRPTSVALDAEGFLYVGCEDGQIHVLNYQYFLNTDRLTRMKIEQSG